MWGISCEGNAPLNRFNGNTKDKTMKYLLSFLMILSLIFAKGREFNEAKHQKEIGVPVSRLDAPEGQQHMNIRSIRNDTTSIWSEDFEGDVSGWVLETGWELTDESSNSPTHSMHVDDDNLDIVTSMVSPLITIPELGSANELMKFNFALWCDLPDFDGDGDNYLDDYYWVDIANLSDAPTHFHTSDNDAYNGNSWWCADPSINGYSDAWVQVLDSPTITIPGPGFSLSAMMKWGIEDPAGADVAGTCTDGWDAANVRVSADGGATWDLLIGSEMYDFSYGYGWIYNDPEYDCGGELEAVSAGWAGNEDWHEVTFDLSSYSGQDVIIRFAFGSDPAYSVVDDPLLTGFQIDNIVVSSSATGETIFTDDADDNVYMIPNNGLAFAWEQIFYDYGDLTRPGNLDWYVYQPGDAFNGNTDLNLSDYAGSDIKLRFTGRFDADEDGGNGSGLYIDDVNIYKIEVNDVPMVQNLNLVSGDGVVNLSWETAGGDIDGDVAYDDGTFEDAISMVSGTSIMGQLFDMPYGVDGVTVHSAQVYGEDFGAGGETMLYGFPIVAGIPATDPWFTASVTTVTGSWTDVDLNWTFQGDFLLAIEVTESIGIAIDSDSAPSVHSWANLGGWATWLDVATENGLTDGEFGIRANVSAFGGVAPAFNVYRSASGGEFSLMFNGTGISDSEYTDNMVQNGTEYCYGITAVYGEDESDMAGPVCGIPEAETIAEYAYDDGEANTSTNATNGNFLAVKFTPNSYPVDLYKAKFNIVGSNGGIAFVNIWDDDGDEGMPGTLLLNNSAIQLVPGWTEKDLYSSGITIEEGSFYVGWMESTNTPPLGVDTDSPADYSMINNGAGWQAFSDYFDGALMIRCEVDSVNATAGIDDDLSPSVPKEFGLKQNYPNPFNPTTTIAFDLAQSGKTTLKVYDLSGKEVMTLIDKNMNAGEYKFGLNASDLSSGMYIYRLTTLSKDGQQLYGQSRKLVLMK